MKSFWQKARFWIIGNILLIFGTILFRIDNGIVDQKITSAFYVATNAIGSRFPTGNEQPWAFFNNYNTYFEILLVIIFVFMLFLGLIKKQRYGFMIRYALFGLIAYGINVGIVVNDIFKGLWGRPRPQMTTMWPNTSPIGPFYMVWDPAFLYDPSLIGKGVSFPSGHVANIVAFITLFYIFMDPSFWAQTLGISKKIGFFRAVKWCALIFTVVGGILTGIARIAAGEHFASDVLWAFGMVWNLTAVFYYFIFRIPQFEKKITNKLHNNEVN
jgi:membrane-associated phospholipid phosphatase